jgi:hypothetical protein
VPQRFHHTLTVVWIRIIDAARDAHPDLPFDALVETCPWLLDKDAPLAFYTQERLYSDEARKLWVEPNLKPLPVSNVAGVGQSRPRLPVCDA